MLPVRNMAMAAGKKTTDRMMAPTSASTAVSAIGWNILPSTPVKAKMRVGRDS